MSLHDTIRFADIPHIPPFYCDYLEDWPKVDSFFELPWRPAEMIEAWQRRGFSPAVDRAALTGILGDQNEELQAGQAARDNIRRLLDPSCLAVVTGQQAGLFSGPSYTIYKALTAIKNAEALTQAGMSAVPVFWIASEDHDWAEIDHVEIPDVEGMQRRIQYPADPAWAGAPVGQLPIGPAMETVRAEFLAALPPTEFKGPLGEMLARHYAEGRSFARALGGLMAELFRPWGLIVIDPADPRLKQLTLPLFQRVLSEPETITSRLLEQNAALAAAGYSPQVLVEEGALPLFLIENGKRRLLRKRGDTYHLKGEETAFSLKELSDRLARSPADFSPNVLLRPLYQDALIPVAGYVGGPAEISYFAQVKALYRWYGQPMPAIFPRVSYTILERKMQRIFEKYHLSFSDLFAGMDFCLQKAVENSVGNDSAQAMNQVETQIAGILDGLQPSLQKVDPTLVDALNNSRVKILYQVSHLRTKFVNAHARQNEALTRQLSRAAQVLYPERNLQERSVNFFYFLSRYGEGLLTSLYEEMDLMSGRHHLWLV